MAIVQNPDTPLGKELAKWEQHRSKYTNDDVPPGNPYVYRHYPKMLYRARAHPKTGKAFCMDVPPNPMLYANAAEFDRACLATEQLNQSCTRVVGSDVEERNALNDGWRDSPVTALEAFEAKHVALGNEAAVRAFRDKGMTPQARAEAAAADASTHEHVADVPRTRRGRKPKAEVVPSVSTTE